MPRGKRNANGTFNTATHTEMNSDGRQISGVITAEAAQRLDAIRAATGWRVKDIISASIVNLHESSAMDSVITAIRALRKEFRVGDKE